MSSNMKIIRDFGPRSKLVARCVWAVGRRPWDWMVGKDAVDRYIIRRDLSRR